MNPVVLVAVIVLVQAVLIAVFWLVSGQKNLFIAYDPDTGGLQPKRRRTLSGAIRLKRKDGKMVRIPMQPEFARPRFDGKGSVLVANIKTGQPMMPLSDGRWVSMDGIYLELAYADDTIAKIRSGTRGKYDALKILMWMAGINLALLVVVVYQFAKAGGVS